MPDVEVEDEELPPVASLESVEDVSVDAFVLLSDCAVPAVPRSLVDPSVVPVVLTVGRSPRPWPAVVRRIAPALKATAMTATTTEAMMTLRCTACRSSAARAR